MSSSRKTKSAVKNTENQTQVGEVVIYRPNPTTCPYCVRRAGKQPCKNKCPGLAEDTLKKARTWFRVAKKGEQVEHLFKTAVPCKRQVLFKQSQTSLVAQNS